MQYAELHCKTNFTFLTGASHPDELVERAIKLRYTALAITDRNSLSGVVRAHAALKRVTTQRADAGADDGIAADEQTFSDSAERLKLVIGAEIVPVDAPPVLLWAPDLAAYQQLSRLITVGRRRAPKGECELMFEDIVEHADGLLAGVLAREVNSSQGTKRLHEYHELFRDRGYLVGSLHRSSNDAGWLQQLQRMSSDSRLPLVAAGDVHYHDVHRMRLFDVVTAIREHSTVDAVGAKRFANAERYLRSRSDIARLFEGDTEAIARTIEIADRCSFSLDELRFRYPRELAPDGLSPFAYLKQLTVAGAVERYQHLATGVPDKVQRLLDHELRLIKDLKYEAYFLTVWDLVRFARERGILCQGRGSAANSAVCYCLGVTAVDPATTDVLFERFISRERNEAPDIDVDFEHERREEVLQYLYGKYGRERAGMTGVVIRYRLRSAIRDVGSALGLSPDRIDALAKQVEGHGNHEKLSDRCAQVGIAPDSAIGQRLRWAITQLVGFPRHLSQHVGGMVMTAGPLHELVPIENAAMEGRTVISWDKNDLDELGILKVDCLSLGMLSAIRRTFALVAQHEGQQLTLANIPADDSDVYDMICRADTIGVFQIESRAQMSMLPRLKPRCYYDLVIEVAIVRPGPIQGQMVHPYLRRRDGDEEVTYASEGIREVLEKTLGVPIFQEQAMRLAVVAAGFTLGEADQLRRAMGAWRRPGVIDAFEDKLVKGMLVRGLPENFARQVFQQIRGFGEYGFPESHAASFALLVYVSAYLKHHHPAAFAVAIINSQPMGFYAPAQLIRDARDHGVQILPVDVNRSVWDCTLESVGDVGEPPVLAIRLGLRMVVGFRQTHAESIVAARGLGLFDSQAEVARRAGLGAATLRLLADADAFGSLGQGRRRALWEALAEERQPKTLPLFSESRKDRIQNGLFGEANVGSGDEGSGDEGSGDEGSGDEGSGDEGSGDEGTDRDDRDDGGCKHVALPEMDPLSEVFADYETTGLSLRGHPVAFFRETLVELGVIDAVSLSQAENDSMVQVAGIVLLRQRPSTAKGITFVTLEDETGTVNLVLHVSVWEQFYGIARRSSAWVVRGRVETKHSVIHVIAKELFDFSQFVGQQGDCIASQSRDFR